MRRLKSAIATFKQSDSGATAIEYALIAAIISLSIITGLLSIREELGLVFGDVVLGFSS